MTWRRWEFAVWCGSGAALVTALVLFVQGREDRLVMLFVVIGLGLGVVLEAAKKLAGRSRQDEPNGSTQGRPPLL
ncbi:hypothetical protein P0Y31_01180 [Knoellia sp. 3-2P3]|uniref:hypothetical protein n=1 Tax=unclassified Knoellia TaxID=2618719 RepID=UPI0023DB1F5A|nr:hypothetical protein [Knoellia sp. 3-2P3]MDF2090945.1 hypothetical protein [Knoellia sp. 3-2P3]